ncbi:hypothetical protein [Streptomyces sp. NPDC000405]
MPGVEPGSTSETHGGAAVRRGQELYVAAERLVFLAEPEVVAVVADTGNGGGVDQRAVQDDMAHLLTSAGLEDVVEVRCLGSQDVDAFMEVAVAGRL